MAGRKPAHFLLSLSQRLWTKWDRGLFPGNTSSSDWKNYWDFLFPSLFWNFSTAQSLWNKGFDLVLDSRNSQNTGAKVGEW